MKCGSGHRIAPVVDQNRGIDGTEAGGLVVSRGRGKTGQAGNAVIAADDVVKDGCSAGPLFVG